MFEKSQTVYEKDDLDKHDLEPHLQILHTIDSDYIIAFLVPHNRNLHLLHSTIFHLEERQFSASFLPFEVLDSQVKDKGLVYLKIGAFFRHFGVLQSLRAARDSASCHLHDLNSAHSEKSIFGVKVNLTPF